jgi:ribose-phosphate pyrophosphokinase
MIKINGIHMGSDCFPNNERIFLTKELDKKLENSPEAIFDFRYHTDIDISMLIMLKKYVDNNFNHVSTTLVMKYIPYSRMDRQIDGYLFTLKYFCQLINDLNFSKVIVLDAHSNVSTALLDRCYDVDVNTLIDGVFEQLKYDVDYVFYPDNGACKRYSEILKLPNNTPYFYGNKRRNLQTGEIINYELVDCPDIKDKNILIIDDLCAKGFTFYNAAQKLRENGAEKVYLYISHCEDSIYKGEIFKTDLINKVFTTDSILTNIEETKQGGRLVVFHL